MNAETEKLYDVVIYELATKKVTRIVGRDLPMNAGHYNAETRMSTAMMMCNERYEASIVDAGQLKVGDMIV